MGSRREIANDFYSSAPTTIYEVVWWGEYFNDDGTGPNVSAFNLRFYDDAGGVPGSIMAEYLGSTPTETIPLGQGPDGPIFEYHASTCRPTSERVPTGSRRKRPTMRSHRNGVASRRAR